MMAFATSIDAAVAGATFDGLGQSVAMACTVIGITAFLLSCVGVFLGKAAGDAIGPRAQIVGGLVLIGLGIKILIEHLYSAGNAHMVEPLDRPVVMLDAVPREFHKSEGEPRDRRSPRQR